MLNLPALQPPPPSSSSNSTNNYPSFNPSYNNHQINNNNIANLRNKKIKKKKSKSKKSKLKDNKSAKAISHATRIAPTNHTYNELLRDHLFTPISGSLSTSESPLKASFNQINLNLNDKEIQKTTLQREREEFLKKPIISEPKKSVSGYQLFASYIRKNAPETIPTGIQQGKGLSILWQKLSTTKKEEWTKKSEQMKIEYISKKDQWLNYVEEAKRLGMAVPQKSTKPILPPARIKYLLALIPNLKKYNKETQFIITKATEMFISFYASKAIELTSKFHELNNDNDSNEPLTISGKHCFDTLQTDHKFNFLRAVTVQKHNHKYNQIKRGIKRKSNNNNNNNHNEHISISSASTSTTGSGSGSSINDNKLPLKKKRRLNEYQPQPQPHTSTTTTTTTAQPYHTQIQHPQPYGYMNSINGQYTTNGFNNYYHPQQPHTTPQPQPQPQPHTQQHPSYIYQQQPSLANSNNNIQSTPFSTTSNIGQAQTQSSTPSTIFSPHPFYQPFYANTNGINNSLSHHQMSHSNNTSQMVSVNQIFNDPE